MPLPPLNCRLPWRIWIPSNTWFTEPTRVLNPNTISIGSAVFFQGSQIICTSLQIGTLPLIFLGWMPFMPPNQQRQSSECNLEVEGNITVGQQQNKITFGKLAKAISTSTRKQLTNRVNLQSSVDAKQQEAKQHSNKIRTGSTPRRKIYLIHPLLLAEMQTVHSLHQSY